MAKVSSRNPSFVNFDQEPSSMSSNGADTFSRKRTIAAVATVAAVGAVALAVGVVMGNNFAPNAATAGGIEVSKVDSSLVLSTMYIEQPSLASMSVDNLNKLVDQYDNTHSPSQWANAFVPQQFVSEWSKMRKADADEEEGGARRLREQRRLIGAYPVALSRVAHEAAIAMESRPIKFESDAARVEKKGSRCVISFDTSNDFSDLIENFNLGNGPIFSINEYTEAGPECPLSSCPGKRILGQGFDGFTLAWNGLKTAVWAEIQSTCSSGISEYVFTGYSRGGAIAAVATAAIYLEGLLPASQIKLITFGAPLVVSSAVSEEVHNVFEQYRFVYRSDPVPAVPPRFLGVRHFGEMRCIDCRDGREGRDNPTFPNLFAFGNHIGYLNWTP